MGAEDGHHLVDRRTNALDDRLEQHRLLRRAEAGRRPGREDDGSDHTTVILSTTTRFVGRWVTRLPSRPIRFTTSSPFVTTPRLAQSGRRPAAGAVTMKTRPPAVPRGSDCVFAIATTPSV